MSKEHEDATIRDKKRNKEREHDSNTSGETSKKIMNPQIVVSFIVLFIFAIFAVINTQEVSIDFLFIDVEIPLIIVILGSFILGALTTMLTGWRSRRHKEKG